jgi:hypothetical protein
MGIEYMSIEEMNKAQLTYERNLRKAKERENKKLRDTLISVHFTNKLLWGALAIVSLLAVVEMLVLING